MPREPRAFVTLTARQSERELRDRFAAAGIETSDCDSRLLVEAATGRGALAWLTDGDRILTLDEATRLDAWAARRLAREPVSRILGLRAFYGRDFEVTPATLDPRADTESVVELALAIVDDQGWREKPISILDIGTGTGCLLVTLLAELPQARGVGTDISPAALMVAERNATRSGVAARAQWQHGRSFAGLSGPFDLVVSNPPYIPSGVLPTLMPEVIRHDPVSALDGGPDGLAVYREIAAGITQETITGWIVLEIGYDQSNAARELFGTCGCLEPQSYRCRPDLGGHLRAVAWKAHACTVEQ
jgi:release factor glutamine methyltransferase